jgi:uncharacterized protein YdeI (YjbR/CyaY-like superfamily)
MKAPENCLIFTSREEWRAWLEEHHADRQEAWLLLYKKKSPEQTLTLEESVEEALCFGWIDGLLNTIDGEKYALRYSPRKPHSVWAENNKQRAERLIAEGRMTAAGLEKIAEAKASGEWEAATAREDISAVPEDLAQGLWKNEVWATFQDWPPSRKKQYLYWLSTAKRPETRQKRLQAIVDTVRAGR